MDVNQTGWAEAKRKRAKTKRRPRGAAMLPKPLIPFWCREGDSNPHTIAGGGF